MTSYPKDCKGNHGDEGNVFDDDQWPIGFDKNGEPNIVGYFPGGIDEFRSTTPVQRQRSKYLYWRRRFEPENAALVIIAERPPGSSGEYFEQAEARRQGEGEPLLNALVKQLGVQPVLKAEGLCELRKHGWVLIDATYEPVNAPGKTQRERNEVITRDYGELCSDLKRLLGARWCEVPLVLIKANVCRLLDPKLTKDGFNVLNKDRRIYFPSNGNQGHFDRQFRQIVPQTLCV